MVTANDALVPIASVASACSLAPPLPVMRPPAECVERLPPAFAESPSVVAPVDFQAYASLDPNVSASPFSSDPIELDDENDADTFAAPIATPRPRGKLAFFRDGEWYFSW
ncbi:MAG TPA: hypothetical protein VHV77_07735, partial [Pirellulales bacterium]|nr:hypothetical protein [Pirellulales bacterium]